MTPPALVNQRRFKITGLRACPCYEGSINYCAVWGMSIRVSALFLDSPLFEVNEAGPIRQWRDLHRHPDEACLKKWHSRFGTKHYDDVAEQNQVKRVKRHNWIALNIEINSVALKSFIDRLRMTIHAKLHSWSQLCAWRDTCVCIVPKISLVLKLSHIVRHRTQMTHPALLKNVHVAYRAHVNVFSCARMAGNSRFCQDSILDISSKAPTATTATSHGI